MGGKTVWLLLATLVTLSFVASASVPVTLPSTVPSYNIVQDNFPGISLEFNVLDHLSARFCKS